MKSVKNSVNVIVTYSNWGLGNSGGVVDFCHSEEEWRLIGIQGKDNKGV